jgi:hypothetical protein
LYFTELEQIEYKNTVVWDMAVWLVTLNTATELQSAANSS